MIAFKLTLLLLISLNAHAFSGGRATPSPVPSSTPAATATPAIPLSPGTVQVKCLNCTTAQSAALPSILAKYQDIRATECFAKFFESQNRIDESKGLTSSQVVAKLRETPVQTTLRFYSVLFSKACGKEVSGGVEWKVACFNAYNACQRSGFMGHEFSHAIGFTHYTAGNTSTGNQQTVPYLIDRAFSACCK